MRRTDPTAGWMWAEAVDLMSRAERLHQQFFRLASSRPQAVWEPPVDVFESEHEIAVVVALPGVSDSQVRVSAEPGAIRIEAERSLPFGEAAVRQLEIPYGRFERRVALPAGRWEDGTRELTHGCLVIRLRRAS